MALCLTLLLAGSSRGQEIHRQAPASAALESRVVRAVPVAIYAPPDVTDSLLHRICAETDAIWKPAGITFTWQRITSTAEAGNRELIVTLDDRRSQDAHESRAVLGWITFTADGPGRSIYLSRRRVENLLLRNARLEKAPANLHEMLVGRALGRALSHELGHFFLKSKSHTSSGLMRPTWSSDEIFSFERHGFELTPSEREAVTRLVTSMHMGVAWRRDERDRALDGSRPG